ncbi:MAG: MFS transporter, partial [Pseudomonadota bacterium]
MASEIDEAPNLSLGKAEFVVLIASLMALNALAIDVMLPALSQIGADFQLTNENDRQLVIIAYVLGFGAPQLIYGPLTDRYGRRRVLFVALAGYVACALISTLVTSFSALLVARFTMGVFSSGCRVVAVSVVRDVFAGRAMAEIMSLVMTIFMVVPILAPAIGQAVLFGGPWQWIFWVLALYAASVFVWTLTRLPETLPEARRKPLNLAAAFGA